jgi:putative heme-binding domain-containing protein
MLRSKPKEPPDVALGRSVFAKNCQECHTIFGAGSKIGPDLTVSKRDDPDFLITSVVDPSAEIAKGFEPFIVETKSGVVYNGLIKEKNEKQILLQVPGKLLTLPANEIEDIRPSKVSIMPVDILQPLDEHEVRSLFLYLTGKTQAPILAMPSNAISFFNGTDFQLWRGAAGWKVEKGEVVPPAAKADEPPMVTSEFLLADDFQLLFQMQSGSGAVEVRGEPAPGLFTKGPRVEFGDGIVLRDSNGTKLAAGKFGEGESTKANAWNKVEISVDGKKLAVRVNGKEIAASEVKDMPARRAIALEGGKAQAAPIRFRLFDLHVLVPKKN